MGNKRRALAIYSGWMGDFMWLVPTIRALSQRFDSLSLVVSEQQKELARSLMHSGAESVVSEVFVDDKSHRMSCASWVKSWAKERDIGTFIDVVGKLKTGLYIPHRFGAEVFIPHRQDAKEHPLAKALHPLAKTMSPRDISGHMVDSYFSMLKDFGIDSAELNFRLDYTQETVDRAEAIIEANNIRDSRSVVLNVGSAQYSKVWRADKFKTLAEHLMQDGLNVVVMGANEFQWNDNYDCRVAAQDFEAGYDGLVLIKDVPLMVNAYLLSSGVFDVSVGNDSFANHVAGSTNQVSAETVGEVKGGDEKFFLAPTRTVTLMGPTQRRYCGVYDPTGTFHKVVQTESFGDFTCLGEPCQYNGVDHVCANYGKINSPGSPCMDCISVDEVAAVVHDQLKNL